MTSKEIHKEHIKEHMQEISDALAISIEAVLSIQFRTGGENLLILSV